MVSAVSVKAHWAWVIEVALRKASSDKNKRFFIDQEVKFRLRNLVKVNVLAKQYLGFILMSQSKFFGNFQLRIQINRLSLHRDYGY